MSDRHEERRTNLFLMMISLSLSENSARRTASILEACSPCFRKLRLRAAAPRLRLQACRLVPVLCHWHAASE